MDPKQINYAAFSGWLPPETQRHDRQVLVQIFQDSTTGQIQLVTLATRPATGAWSHTVDLVRAR
jgi:hypothetical protein